MKPEKKSRGRNGGRHALSSEGRKVNMGFSVLPSTRDLLQKDGRPMGVIIDGLVKDSADKGPRHIGEILDDIGGLIEAARAAIKREDAK